MTTEQSNRSALVATVLAGLLARQGRPDAEMLHRESEPLMMDRMIVAAERWADRIEERARTQRPG